jgi:hypothetical protein
MRDLTRHHQQLFETFRNQTVQTLLDVQLLHQPLDCRGFANIDQFVVPPYILRSNYGERPSSQPRVLRIAFARGARRGNPDHETEQARGVIVPLSPAAADTNPQIE